MSVSAKRALIRGFLRVVPMILVLVFAFVPILNAQVITGPSNLCHVTDGTFTICPNGSVEWSDVTPVFFSESQSYLYADQADLDPLLATPVSGVDTLMLMYDECGKTQPLGSDDSFLLHFMSVEEEAGVQRLEHYNVRVFADDTIVFILDGVLQPPGRASVVHGQRGDADFGTSPNCNWDHLIVEFQVPLTAAGGGSYSSDPLWWVGDVPDCAGLGITGASSPMNVGQRAQLSATGLDPDPAVSVAITYLWTIDGLTVGAPVIKDYSESTDFAWSTTAMGVTDFDDATISFYWKPAASQIFPLNTGPVSRTVRVVAQEGAATCDAQLTISVERNDSDITKQAEDFYTSNHPAIPGDPGLIRVDHEEWHNVVSPCCPANYDGDLFFDFHNQFLSRFNSWRAEFGYPPLVTWDPETAFPSGIDVDHASRSAGVGSDGSGWTPSTECTGMPDGGKCGKPRWFTTAGGDYYLPLDAANDARFTIGTEPACTDGPDVGTTTDLGQDMLADWGDGIDAGAIPDRDMLGCSATRPWHDRVHGAIGAGGFDMLTLSGAPRDPIFWRFHGFVDTVSQDWLLCCGSPHIIWQSPFRLFQFITELPSITVLFSEPVFGVSPDDLTVIVEDATVAATQVTGENGTAGPFVFSFGNPHTLADFRLVIGFPQFPPTLLLNVQVAPGGIVGLDREPFGGESWTYVFIDQRLDLDEDGVNDGDEARIFRTNPRKADTDEDGMFDGYETKNYCLNPLGMMDSYLDDHDAPRDATDNDADDDPDGDGLSNLQEFILGSDPCPPLPEPPNDSDLDGVPNDLDNCPSIPNTTQTDTNNNGQGEACEHRVLQHSTSAFLLAFLDGRTVAEAVGLEVTQDPSLLDQLARIVNFRATVDPTTDKETLARNLVQSQVNLGMVRPEDADALVDAILGAPPHRFPGVPEFAGPVAIPALIATIFILLSATSRLRRRVRVPL